MKAASLVAVFDEWETTTPELNAGFEEPGTIDCTHVAVPSLAKTAQGWGSLVVYLG